MKRCLDLGRAGLGHVAPNPLVGSVIVARDLIIGEGYHQRYGQNHAEVNAIQSVTRTSLLQESVLYVNLEPCSHTGKTPPCADLIIRTGIPEVVVGMVDPNPLVSGNGIGKLRAAGIKTTVDVLKDGCSDLNRRFVTYYSQKRPYIILKLAKTKDGFIDMIRNEAENGIPTWITNGISKKLVHKWRTEEQAILIGTNTAMLDDPKLNVREWEGPDPIRMVLDRNLRLPHTLHLFDNTQETWVFNARVSKMEDRIRYVQLDFEKDVLKQLMDHLYDNGIQSLFVEGGRQLAESLLAAGLWDEARIFTGDKYFHRGVPAPDIPLHAHGNRVHKSQDRHPGSEIPPHKTVMPPSNPEKLSILSDELLIYYNQREY